MMGGPMARYLSPEWFAELARSSDLPERAAEPEAVLEQVVEDAPDGPVTYRVEIAGGQARVSWPVPAGATAPDLRITCSWATAVSLASGELSSQQALARGALRVKGKGSLARLAEVSARLAGLDPVPAEVRAATSY